MSTTSVALTGAIVFSLTGSAWAQMPDASGQGAGRPANLCQELVAFVHQPDATKKAGEPPPQLATAVSAKKTATHPRSLQPVAPLKAPPGRQVRSPRQDPEQQVRRVTRRTRPRPRGRLRRLRHLRRMLPQPPQPLHPQRHRRRSQQPRMCSRLRLRQRRTIFRDVEPWGSRCAEQV